MSEEFDWTPQEKQLKFLSSQADECFYGGSAGGGKSESLLAFNIARREKYPGTVGLMLRRTLPELEKGNGLIPRSKTLLSRVAKWSERKKWWTFSNGSVLEFGYCDQEKDVYKYMSGEYADICFDELTHFTRFQYTYMRSRCRTTIKGCSPLMRSASNPGNVGHAWVHEMFVKGREQGKKWTDDIEGGFKMTMQFIPARLQDNKYLNNDDSYRRNLMSLDPAEREALLMGNWNAFKGRYFTDWDPDIHVMERDINRSWGRMLSIDYGYVDPCAALWGAEDEKGRLYIYREWYKSGFVAEEQAKAIMLEQECDPRMFAVKSGQDSFSKHGDTGRSIAEAWATQGLYVYRASSARVPGWQIIRSLLKHKVDDIPALTVHPRCENLIRMFPDIVHNESVKSRVEDIDQRCEDHSHDALRYMVNDWRYQKVLSTKPEPIPFDISRYMDVLAKQGSKVSPTDRVRRMKVVH